MMRATLAALLFAGLVAYRHDYFTPPEFKWLLVAALASVYLLRGAFRLASRRAIACDAIDLILLGFTGYAALSLLWSPDPRNGAVFLVCWLPLWVIFSAIRNADASHDGAVFAATALAAAAALVHHQFFPLWWSGFHNENYVTEFMLATLPFLGGWIAWHWQRPVWRAGGILLLCAVLGHLWIQNPSKIEFFVLPVAATLMALPWLLRHKRRMALILALALPTLLGGVAWLQWHGQNGYGGSLLPRLGLYFDTLLLWWRHPLLGNGAGSFAYLFPEVQEAHLQYLPALGQAIAGKFTVANAVHNDGLQFLSEFGLIGLMCLALFVWQVARRVRAQSSLDPGARVGLGALAILFATSLIGFPLQNPATALLAAVSAGMVARAAGLPRAGCELSRVAAWSLAAIMLSAVAGMAGVAWRMDAAQREYFLVGRYYKADPQRAFAHNLQAHRHNPLDWRIRVQLYESLLHWNRATGTPPLAPDEYDRIYAITRSAGPQPLLLIGRLQYLLDTGRHQQRQAEVNETLGTLKQHFPRNADVWIADAYHGVLVQDRAAATSALEKARALPLTPVQQMQQNALESMVETLPR